MPRNWHKPQRIGVGRGRIDIATVVSSSGGTTTSFFICESWSEITDRVATFQVIENAVVAVVLIMVPWTRSMSNLPWLDTILFCIFNFFYFRLVYKWYCSICFLLPLWTLFTSSSSCVCLFLSQLYPAATEFVSLTSKTLLRGYGFCFALDGYYIRQTNTNIHGMWRHTNKRVTRTHTFLHIGTEQQRNNRKRHLKLHYHR